MHSSRSTPVAPATPTPSSLSTLASPRTPSQTVTRRRPLNPQEYHFRKPLRDNPMFAPFKSALQEVKTLVSLDYKAKHCRGKLVPIPYPRDDNGNPVVPSALISHVETQGWEESPHCFCVIRGRDRIAVLYTPRHQNSPAYRQVCLVCPESECPYFVNVQELYEDPEYCHRLLSVGNTVTDVAQPSPKNQSVRIPSWKARASGVTPTIDQLDTVSKLLSCTGISYQEFDSLFESCSKCKRVSRIPHSCLIEIDDDSELDDDLELVLGN